MTSHSSLNQADFDKYAADYDTALAKGLSISGEDKNYFAQGRIAWLAGCLHRMHEEPQSLMDFGCGTAFAVPFMRDLIKVDSITGVDNSAKLLDVAKTTYGSERTQFLLLNEYQPREEIDLAFCNGVFHHIPLNERAFAVNYIYRSLRPGGLFALWENNP